VIYGYARCSTTADLQDIERQARDLAVHGVSMVFSEYIRGTAEVKPELDKLFNAIESGDTLAVTEVSRLSRDVHQLCHVLEIAQEKRIALKCGALTLDFTAGKTDPMNKAMFYMMGIFADLERGVTVERIKSGLEHAKEKGAAMGRPRKTVAEVPEEVKALLPAYLAGEFGVSEFARRTGLTRPSIYKYLKLLEVAPKQSRHITAAAVPPKIRELYPAYKAGEIGVSEYARRANVSRDTIYRHIALMEQQGLNSLIDN